MKSLLSSFKKIEIIKDSKKPKALWRLPENQYTDFNKMTDGNYGVICGKINNITVIDLDMYKWNNNSDTYNELYEELKDLQKYNTLTVKTANNGIHLYFNYDNDLKTKIHNSSKIDIKNDKSYVIGPLSQINDKQYTILYKYSVKTIPDKLKQLLLKYLYDTSIVEEHKKKLHEADKNNRIETTFKYDMNNKIILDIISKIPYDYLKGNLNNWLKFTSFCKILNVYDIWIETANKFDKCELCKKQSFYDNIDVSYYTNIVPHFMKLVKCEIPIHYFKYKDLPENIIKPDVTIHKDKLGYDFFKENVNYICKSDTGTGKTTSFKHYIYALQEKYNNVKVLNKCEKIPVWDNNIVYAKDELLFIDDDEQQQIYDMLHNSCKHIFEDNKYKKVKPIKEKKPVKKKVIVPTKINNKCIDPIVKIINENGQINKYNEQTVKPVINNNISYVDTNIKKLMQCENINESKINYKSNKVSFISIVSRVTLGFEQYTAFNLHGVKCEFYKNIDYIDKHSSLVIQLDSIKRIKHIDMSNKILFLDEFNSIIEYLITSPTLKTKRVLIFQLFLKMIRTAKQVIAVDADISDICFVLLKHIGLQYEFYDNTFKHAKDVPAYEIELRDDLINKLLIEDKFIVCCDSKVECKSLYNDLLLKNPDIDIKLITSELSQDEYINLDDHDKIIMSPKIIYGLDSVMKRSVYCVYKAKTINPRSMIQQVNRCRNIISINYLFLRKYKGQVRYENIDDCLQLLKQSHNQDVEHFDDYASNEENNIYIKLLAMCKYNEDCYNSNKFVHFKKLLKDRGVNDKEQYYNLQKEDILTHNALVQQELKTFSSEDIRIEIINSYLKLPHEKIDDYKEYYLDEYKLKNHFHLSNYLFLCDHEYILKLKDICEFKTQYVTSTANKISFIKEYEKKFNIDIGDGNNKYITATPNLSKEECDKLFITYKKLFNYRGKETDLTNNYIIIQQYVNMFKQLFGGDIINVDRKKVNKIKYRYYKINKDNINKQFELFNYRQPFDAKRETKEIREQIYKDYGKLLYISDYDK